MRAAPASASQNLFIDPATGQPLPFPTAVTSGLSVGVPGTLMTWQRGLGRFGRFSLAHDLRPAEHVARRGFVVDDTFREETRENQSRFAQFASTSRLFLPGGQLPVVGSRLRNPDLAATYAQIARRGIGALYGGAVGRDVVQTVHNLPLASGATLTPRPGGMTLADLAAYSAPFVAPTHVRYRGDDVYSMAPSSSGGTTVGESLNILSNFNLRAETPVQEIHHVARVHAPRVRRPQPLRRRSPVRERAGSAVALTRVRPPAGVSDQPGAPAHQSRRAR